MNRKYYTGMDLLEEIKKRNIKEDTKIFNINADTTFIYKNGNLYNCYDNKLIGSLLEIVDCEFMVLEDNTEEIEELEKEQEAIANPKTMLQEIRFYYDSNKMGDKINEIIRYIKRKDKNND